MIKIKDYIFNENEIQYMNKTKENLYINFRDGDIETIPKATFEDIEWNYGGQVSSQVGGQVKELENKIKELKKERIDLSSRIYEATEYIGNGNLEIPKKTREKFIKILKGEEK